MAKPIASFGFTPDGLSVLFIDRSAGVPTSWSWDFGFQLGGVEQTSTLQNPPAVVFPAAGTYLISLTASNSDGPDTFSFYMTVQVTPGLNLSIQQMVEYELPSGISYDSIGFTQGIRKWQLYLQEAANILDEDVFNEAKWPPLYNVLISKLIVYDLIIKASTSSMASFIAAAETLNTLKTQIISGTIQVADYSLPLIQAYPLTVNLIIIDGVSKTSGALADLPALLSWLNGLLYGNFSVDGGGNLISLGNSHILTTFNYTHNGTGTNTSFTQSNARVVPINQSISTSGSAGTGRGPLKSLETGPSKAAWYDSSAFWATIFKSVGNGINGQAGGIFGSIISDICNYSRKLGVKMPMCESYKIVRPFIIARGNCPDSENNLTFLEPWT